MNQRGGDLQALAAAPRNDECLLGFDFGLRRIGVAIGQRLTLSARPLCTISARDGEPDWAQIDALVSEWQPAALIVGLPLGVDGGEQAISRAARVFAAALGRRFARPVHLCDERYSSREANARFAIQRQAGLKRRRDAANLDAAAAAIILESWLAQ